MSWRKITFITVALIVLLGGSVALSLLFVSMKPELPVVHEEDLVRLVKAETVMYNKIISPVSREGRVVSSKEVLLVSEASGKIEKGEITLKDGESFKKGQLLCSIYKDEAELALKASKSSFLKTLSNILPDLKTDYPNQYNEYYNFFNSIKIDSDLPDLPEIQEGKLKIFLSSQGVLSEYYSIKQDEKKLSRYSLYAPFNGAFSSVNYEVGAYVNSGTQIGTMIQTDNLEIKVPVENLHSEWIKVGDKVKVFTEGGDSYYNGTVTRKSEFITPETQSRSFYINVPNDNKGLYTGQYLTVEFPGQEIESAMEIPRAGVFNSNEVFSVIDGKLKKQEINILKWNESTLIFNGLPEGMTIVTEALINVKENSPVKVEAGTTSGSGINDKTVIKTGSGR